MAPRPTIGRSRPREVGIVVVLLFLWVLLVFVAIMGEALVCETIVDGLIMSVYVILVLVGALTVLWGEWLLPRQLSGARAKMSVDQQRRFDYLFQRRSVRRLFATPAICGGLLIVVGVVFLLTS